MMDERDGLNVCGRSEHKSAGGPSGTLLLGWKGKALRVNKRVSSWSRLAASFQFSPDLTPILRVQVPLGSGQCRLSVCSKPRFDPRCDSLPLLLCFFSAPCRCVFTYASKNECVHKLGTTTSIALFFSPHSTGSFYLICIESLTLRIRGTEEKYQKAHSLNARTRARARLRIKSRRGHAAYTYTYSD
jgi:hypothetical protein